MDEDLSMSLDEIIRKRRSGEQSLDRPNKKACKTNKTEEHDYTEVRMDDGKGEYIDVEEVEWQGELDLTEEERIQTPLEVLQYLSENGLQIEFETQELTKYVNLSETSMPEEDRARRWRVEYNCQDVAGLGLAPRKELAKQVAAANLIDKIHTIGHELKMPKYNIPTAARINPFLFDRLDSKLRESGLELSFRFSDDEVDNPNINSGLNSNARRRTFFCNCSIGILEFAGRSCRSFDYAKLYAAKHTYETLFGEEVKLDPIVSGEKNCGNAKDYTVVNSEAYHVYVVIDNGCKYYSKTSLFPPGVINEDDGEGQENMEPQQETSE